MTLFDLFALLNIGLLFLIGIIWAERERKKLDNHDKVYKETYL